MNRDEDTATTASGTRVLVVEDEPLVSLELETILEDHGFQVAATATTVSTAVELVATSMAQAALLDANLQGEKVDNVAAALAAHDIPFAFVTGYGREGLPENFQNALVVEKPFRAEDIVAALDALLDSDALALSEDAGEAG